MLGKSENKSSNNEDDKLNFIFEINQVIRCISDSNQLNDTETIIEDDLVLFTDHFLVVFKIIDRASFRLNVDFESCLKQMLFIDLNQIETIEISKCQNYIIIELAQFGKQKEFYKFVTYDTSLTQVFLNNLISNLYL